MPEITRREFFEYIKYGGIVAGGVLLGAGAGCLDEEIRRSGQSTENYSFGEVSEEVLASGFKSPLGLSELTLNLPPPPPESIENKVLLGEAIFMDGSNNSFSSVWKYSSFEEDNPVSKLYEFQDSDFSVGSALTETPERNIFTGCVEIPRRGIVVYSNVSNKLFLLAQDRGTWIRIGPLMQSDELLGITDIAVGLDGLLYAAQSGIRSTEEPMPGSSIRPPRIISIDPYYQRIQEQFLLKPSDDPNFENNQGLNVKEIKEGNFLEIGNKYSVVENSPSGIIDTGIKLYGSSSLDNMVLAYDGKNVFSVSTDPRFFPTSMQVSERGDLVTAGLFKSPYDGKNSSGIDYILSDQILSGQPIRQSLYRFTDNLGNSEEVPIGSDVKMLLKEGPNKIGIYSTNTNSGKLESLEVQKV